MRSVGRGSYVAAESSARLTTFNDDASVQFQDTNSSLLCVFFLHTHNEHMVGKGACRKQLDGILLNLGDSKHTIVRSRKWRKRREKNDENVGEKNAKV